MSNRLLVDWLIDWLIAGWVMGWTLWITRLRRILIEEKRSWVNESLCSRPARRRMDESTCLLDVPMRVIVMWLWSFVLFCIILPIVFGWWCPSPDSFPSLSLLSLSLSFFLLWIELSSSSSFLVRLRLNNSFEDSAQSDPIKSNRIERSQTNHTHSQQSNHYTYSHPTQQNRTEQNKADGVYGEEDNKEWRSWQTLGWVNMKKDELRHGGVNFNSENENDYSHCQPEQYWYQHRHQH